MRAGPMANHLPAECCPCPGLRPQLCHLLALWAGASPALRPQGCSAAVALRLTEAKSREAPERVHKGSDGFHHPTLTSWLIVAVWR